MNRFAAVLLTFTFWAAAQSPPNLSGIWELKKAVDAPAGQMPDTMKIKIEQQGGAFEMTVRATMRGNLEQQFNRFVAGQETKGEMYGAPLTSRTEWEGDTLVVHSVAVILGKELRLISRFGLAGDGNTLTFRQRHQYGSDPEGENVHVLERRPASSWEPDEPPKHAEEVYRNIQIMKGVPAPRLRTVMMNLTRWLGVDCAHCHVRNESKNFEYEKDDKPAKQTARNMFRMVRAINQDHFPGDNLVTCWTCHRGQARPQSLQFSRPARITSPAPTALASPGSGRWRTRLWMPTRGRC